MAARIDDDYMTAEFSGRVIAIARAAACFISSVIWRARTFNAPRNMPGNASTLLIWFG